MSTDNADEREPGPPRLKDIADDLLAADPNVPIEPSYQSSSTAAEAITTRAITDHASVTVDGDTAEELGLDAKVLAYLSGGDQNHVTLNIEAHGPDRIAEAGSVVDLTPTAARQIAIQLLASAAVADDD